MAFTRPVTGEGIVQQPLEDFPPPGFPVLYSDAIASATRATPNVKFYLARHDPHPFGAGGANTIPVAQVIMPNMAFAASTMFMVQTLALLVKEGEVPLGALTEIAGVCRQAGA
jgi:hypothetical protein